jgi:sec-independent protein translocase protein TatC
MTLVEHIRELRGRLLWCIGLFFIFFLICFNFSDEIFNLLMLPLAKVMKKTGGTQRMIYTNLTEGFFTYIKVSAFSALFLTIPIVAMQVWKFVAPGLYKNEKKAFLPFMIASPVLFLTGAFLVYYLIIPIAWGFLLNFQTNVKQTILPIELEAKIGEYLHLVMSLILAFGFCFQIPILLVLLTRAGIISKQTLIDKRKYAIVLSFCISAITTPPDVISQFGLALPLILLYELSILFSEKSKKEITCD